LRDWEGNDDCEKVQYLEQKANTTRKRAQIEREREGRRESARERGGTGTMAIGSRRVFPRGMRLLVICSVTEEFVSHGTKLGVMEATSFGDMDQPSFARP
jgi:hypothetical protein